MRATEFITEIFDKSYFRVRWDERSDWEWVGGFTASDGSNIEILFVMQDEEGTWHVEWSRSGSQDRINTPPKLATKILSTINAVLKQFIRKEQPLSIIVGVTNNDIKKLEVYHKMLGALDYHWEKMSKGEIRQYKLKPNNLWYRYYAGIDNDEYPDDEELEEDWKTKAKGLAAAGAIALAGQSFVPKTVEPTLQTISAQLPRVSPEVIQQVTDIINTPLAKALRREALYAGIEGAELAQLLAQCAHETQNFMSLKEFGGSLDFRKYDPKFAPKKAAALGNTHPGDGARYHGRGFIQLTGRYNYKKAGEALGLPLEAHPELVERPDVAAKVAIWYWQNRVAPKVDNFKDTRAVTKPINSGLQGLSDRENKFNAVMQIYNRPQTR